MHTTAASRPTAASRRRCAACPRAAHYAQPGSPLATPTPQAELWRHVRHVRKMYYQVWGPQDFARGRPGRNAAVKVDPQRLGDLIETAIHEMEPF